MSLRHCGLAALFALVLVLPDPASAQRDRFFGTLPALYRSLAGVYGDEGSEIAAHVETLSEALAAWDREAAAAELDLRSRLRGADAQTALDVQVTLSTLYAERSRFRDALREIDEAIRINPTMAPLYRFKGVLLQTLGSAPEAADTFRAAWLLEPEDAQNAYRLVVQRSAQTTDAEIEQALKALATVERELVLGQRRRAESPFPVLAINDDVGRAMPFAPGAYARAFALLLGGEFANGMSALRGAVAADPLIADPAARLEPLSQGIAALRRGMVADAIGFLEIASSRAPGSSEAHRMLGTARVINGDIIDAVRHLRTAVQLNPRNERATLTLARTLEGVDQVEDATQVLRAAVRELPEAGAVRWMLASLGPRRQRTDDTDVELISGADRLVLLAGKGELLGRVAHLAQAHLNYERAASLLEQRVALTPNNAAAHGELGSAYIALGREDAGYAELVVALWLDPDAPATLTALGRVHLAAQRYPAAVETLEKAIGLTPSNGEALRALSDALLHVGKTEDGRQRAQEAARVQAEEIEAQRRLRTVGALGAEATLSMRQEQYGRAIELWQQVIQLEPENAGNLLRLAEAFVGAKRLEEADAILRMAVLAGAGPEGLRRLAEVLVALGRPEQSAVQRQAYREQRLQELRRSGSAGR